MPESCRLFGIHSGVKHSVGGSRYGKARCAAFMGLAILEAEARESDLRGYLCNLTPEALRRCYYKLLPGKMRGTEFLDRYRTTADSVTRVEPNTTYSVRGAVEHAVYENARVQRFIACLAAAGEEASDKPNVRHTLEK